MKQKGSGKYEPKRGFFIPGPLYFICFPFLIFLPLPHGTTIPLKRRPVVTTALCWINIIIFVFTRHSGYFEPILMTFGYIPAEYNPLTLFTHMFLHGGYLHLLGNMLSLYIFGANVEDRMGRLGYLGFYLACGLGAVLFHSIMVDPAYLGMPVVGASGAIYGVMGGFLILFPLGEIKVTYIIMFMMLYWRVRMIPTAALFLVPFFVVLNIMLYLITVNIAVGFMAHVGGFLFALPCAFLFRLLFPPPREEPLPEIFLEEEMSKGPKTASQEWSRKVKEALFGFKREEAIRLYRQGKGKFGRLPMPPVDQLDLAGAMVEEGQYEEAVALFRRAARDESWDYQLRVRAGYELGRLYIHHLGNIPRGVWILRRILKKFPGSLLAKDIQWELAELELRGSFRVDWKDKGEG
jgi:membrane associated rhomboid family serine protease